MSANSKSLKTAVRTNDDVPKPALLTNGVILLRQRCDGMCWP